ncbi:hypothetical protein K438DRAFT_1778685 [Mycena galopus ATCC 62051]|nr:hypothetical protein K438DRAFT_1778685 [Mycena galopus ATCC 62051]
MASTSFCLLPHRGSNVWYHAGLEYQVHNCGYFRWLAPELLAAAERRVQDAPAGGAPPYHPRDYPHDPWANSPPPSHSSIAATLVLDPALVTSSEALPSTQPRHLSPPSSMPPSTQSGKPKCAARPCKRLAGSQSCTYKMCKQCCEQQKKGCGYTGHRKNQDIVPMSSFNTAEPGDPSVLSRPTPMFSYEHPLSSVDAPPTSLPPKVYKKPMDPEWAHRYNKNHEVQEQRRIGRIAEEERRKQDLMFERQVRFCFWDKNGVEPTMFRQQGLKTLRLNMASHPELLKKMDLAATDEIGIYDFNGLCWDREDVNHVREVVAHEVLLVRRFGVTDCPRLDDYIAKYSPTPIVTRRALPAASTHKQKRAASSLSEPDRRPSKVPRMSSPPSPLSPSLLPPSPIFSATSPPSSPTSPSSSPPLLSRCPSSESSTGSTASLTQPLATPTDYDALWKTGRVLNPDGCGTWPEGMYARDMAAAFRLVGNKQVPENFLAVFGIPFPKGAWYQQQRAWKQSSQEERDRAAALPRTANGLYTVWRDTSSGWAHILNNKPRY